MASFKSVRVHFHWNIWLLPARARICRPLWTLRHRFQESIPYEKLILTWTWDMGTSIPNLFPNRFQESIFHPLTRLQIPAQARLKSVRALPPWIGMKIDKNDFKSRLWIFSESKLKLSQTFEERKGRRYHILWRQQENYHSWARICRPFMEHKNRF